MHWIIILIVVISIISKSSKKKQQEKQAAERKAAREVQTMEQDPTPRPVPQGRSARFPDEFEGPKPQTPPRPKQVTMAETAKRNNPIQAEIEARRRALQQTMMPPQKKAVPPLQKAPIDTTITHVVKPVTESAHAHTESSMGGGEPGPPKAAPVLPISVRGNTEPKIHLPKLGFTRDEVVKGLLYAEILGKPKALRK